MDELRYIVGRHVEDRDPRDLIERLARLVTSDEKTVSVCAVCGELATEDHKLFDEDEPALQIHACDDCLDRVTAAVRSDIADEISRQRRTKTFDWESDMCVSESISELRRAAELASDDSKIVECLIDASSLVRIGRW